MPPEALRSSLARCQVTIAAVRCMEEMDNSEQEPKETCKGDGDENTKKVRPDVGGKGVPEPLLPLFRS